jgi:hypothetical protein
MGIEYPPINTLVTDEDKPSGRHLRQAGTAAQLLIRCQESDVILNTDLTIVRADRVLFCPLKTQVPTDSM